MSDKQRRDATALIRGLCANYDNGHCLPLSDYEYIPCPQITSNSLICKYFRDAVLPGDKLLQAQIMGGESVRSCEICGQPFRAVSNRAKYCERGAKAQKTRQAKTRMQRMREAI